MKKLFLLFILSFTTISCVTMALKSVGVYDTSVVLQKYSNNTQEIVFFPMHHIGTKEFYNDVIFKIDSLQKNDYMVFFESVAIKDSLSAEVKDTLSRKIRKIFGIHIDKKGYLDTVNNTLGDGKIKLNNKIKLVNQQKPKLMGFRKNIDSVTDVPTNKLIEQYEKDKGKIVLEECDFKIPLNEPYLNCSKIKDKKSYDEVILGFRNEFIVKNIIESKHKKMAIVFGEKHIKGIIELLQKQDPNWKEVKN